MLEKNTKIINEKGEQFFKELNEIAKKYNFEGTISKVMFSENTETEDFKWPDCEWTCWTEVIIGVPTITCGVKCKV